MGLEPAAGSGVQPDWDDHLYACPTCHIYGYNFRETALRHTSRVIYSLLTLFSYNLFQLVTNLAEAGRCQACTVINNLFLLVCLKGICNLTPSEYHYYTGFHSSFKAFISFNLSL